MIVRAATLMLALGLAIQVSANGQQPADVRATQQVQPMPGDNRLVQYVFDANDTFTVMTRPQSATHIQLAPDESLQLEFQVSGASVLTLRGVPEVVGIDGVEPVADEMAGVVAAVQAADPCARGLVGGRGGHRAASRSS